MPITFFVIKAEGFKFGVLGVLVAVFQQLNQYISLRLPLIELKEINIDYATKIWFFHFNQFKTTTEPLKSVFL